MNRVIRKSLAILILISVYPVGLKAQDMPPTLVETDKVETREFNDQITLVGRTAPHVESRIVSEVSGQIQGVNSGEGVWVSKGSPLITLDSDQIGFLYQAKQAEAKQAALQADLAQTNLERNERLFRQELISESTIDSVRTWVAITKARAQQLEAEENRLKRDFDNCTIRAPYSGYTGERLVDIGEWVNPGDPVFEMVELSLIKITIDLPERYFGRLSIGSPVGVSVSNEAQNAPMLKGTVIGIAPNASQETHTFPVIIQVNNDQGRLGGGMLVRATLSLDNKFSSLAVSKDAIIRQGMNTMVYTVVEGKAAPVPVQTTSTDGKMVAVEADGLQEGMEVVVRGNERIFPGSPVRVGNAQPQSQNQKAPANNGG